MRKWISLGVSLLALNFAPQQMFAQQANALTTQRQQYLQARQALREGDRSEFAYYCKILRNYPLYPYLRYAEILPKLPARPEADVADYLKQYADCPLADKLRTQWLLVLIKQNQWPLFFKYANLYSNDANMQCLVWQAQLATGKANLVWSQLPKVWLTGQSLPDSCTDVFSAWQKQGKLTNDLIWQRIQLAVKAKNWDLVSYLANLLPPNQRSWVNLWRKVADDPNLILHPTIYNTDNTFSNTILVDGIHRLAKKQPERAASFWQQIVKTHHFTRDQQQEALRSLALGLAVNHLPAAGDLLTQVQVDDSDSTLRAWRVRNALVQSDWPKVVYWINKMPDDERTSACWRYWLARANEQLGNNREAQMAYESLAKERNYYGLMASQRLKKPYHIQALSMTINENALNKVAKQPGIIRAYEFYQLKLLPEARQEWQAATQKMDLEQLYLAAKLAQRWGWYDQSLYTAAKASHQDDLGLRFPLVHLNTVLASAKQHKLEPAWSYAVMRQESAFYPGAKSGAGALGLMQLLPSTAKSLAPNNKFSPQNLLDPQMNIQFGSKYLNQILRAYNGNFILATAAYNAGFGRIRPWIPKQPMAADLWIETLPWSETRDYVKNILAYTVIYQQRLGQTTPLFSNVLVVP